MSAERLLRHTPASLPERLAILTPREAEILMLLIRGDSSKEVARTLGISVRTADDHRQAILRKMEARNATALAHEVFAERLRRALNDVQPNQGKT